MYSMDIRIHTVDVDHEVDEVTHGQIQREHRGPGPPEKRQKIRVSEQHWSGSSENHEATMSAFNVGQSSTRQQNAINMAFCWWADDGPFIVVFGSSIPSSTKKMDPL